MRHPTLLSSLLAASLLAACGGGGGRSAPPASEPAPSDPPAPTATIRVLSPAVDTTHARGGLLPVRYVAAAPAGAQVDAYVDKDGDPATTNDQAPLAEDLGDPDGTERLVRLPADGLQASRFHVLLVVRKDGAVLAEAASRGHVRFGNRAFVHGMGGTSPNPFDARTAAMPDGGHVTAGGHVRGGVVAEGSAAPVVLPDDLPRYSAWIARHDADGVPTWVRHLAGYCTVRDVSVSADGTIHAAGSFHGTLRLLGGADESAWHAGDGSELFVMSLSPDGALRWMRRTTQQPPEGPVSVPTLRLAPRSDGGVAVLMRGYAPLHVGVRGDDAILLDGDAEEIDVVASFAADGALHGAETAAHDEGVRVSVHDIAALPYGDIAVAVSARGEASWRAASGDERLRFGVPGAANDTEVGYLRLDRRARVRRLHIVSSVGPDGGELALAAHPDGSITWTARFVPVAGALVLGADGDAPFRLAQGEIATLVMRADAQDRHVWAEAIRTDNGGVAYRRDPRLVALPDGGVALARSVRGVIDLGGPLPLFAEGTDVLLIGWRADGTRRYVRLDGGLGDQKVGALATTAEGALLLALRFGAEGMVYGAREDRGRTLLGAPYAALVRINADGDL